MSLAVFLAALLHAGWNVLVKLGLDHFSTILFLALVQGGIALVLLPFFDPPARAAWPWVLAGSALHSGYKLVLIQAYRHGDLSQVYPLARGTAPLIVAVAGALLLGEGMNAARLAALLSIAAGIMLMAYPRRPGESRDLSEEGHGGRAEIPASAGVTGGLTRPALGFALATACFTAAYTMADGIGARIAGAASGFTLWMFFLDGLAMLAYGLATRGTGALAALLPAWRGGLAAGAMSLGSYWIAVWAFTQAPLALVAALRETSVLFALLIAFFLLGERVGPRRWAAAALIVAGVILMRVQIPVAG
jgi:drug/metabolite transporter (DMT)-like permease